MATSKPDQCGVLRNGDQAFVGLLGHRLARIVQEIGIGTITASADTSTELVQLGEAESVGTIHNQRVRIRDIQTRLDNRRAQQHIDVTMPEIADDLVELLTSHLAMGNAYPGFGNELPCRRLAFSSMPSTRLWM